MIKDTLSRVFRYLKPSFKMLLNNRGEIDGDPNPANSDPGVTPPVDGGDETSWLDVLPEDARNDPEITKYKTPDEFYKGYKEKVSMVGKKGVIVPGENATPEELNKFYDSIGRPKDPSGYKIDIPEGLHQSIQVTDESKAEFGKIGHELGLTNKQVNGLNGWYLNRLSGLMQQQEQADTQAMQKAETALRQEWGDKFDDNRASVAKLMLKVGGQELIDSMGGEKGLGNNPMVLKALGKIAGMLSEDQINSIQGPVSPAQGNETKEQALAKINDITGNKDNPLNKPLFDENDPKHDDAVKERLRLYNIAYGGEA